MATPPIEDQMNPLLEEEENTTDQQIIDELPKPGEILTVNPRQAMVSPEFTESLQESTQDQPIQTTRGELPSFERGFSGVFTAPLDVSRATGLDFTTQLDPRKRENAEGIYNQYFKPYDPENTESKNQIDNALLGATRVITSIRDPQDPYAEGYGGRRTFSFPAALQTGVKDDGTPYTREELVHERARFIRLVGGTSVVVPSQYNENNQAVGGREIALPVLAELRGARELAPEGRMTYLESSDLPSWAQELTGEFEIKGPIVPFYSNIVSGDNTRVGKFARFLDEQGYLDPYMKRDLIFAQGTGALDSYRNEGRALDPYRALVNIGVALYDYANSDESAEDPAVVENEKGEKSINWEYFPMTATKIAERTGMDVEMVEKVMLFSPDTLTRVQNIAPELVIGFGISTAARIGLAEVGTASMARWIKSQPRFKGASNVEQAAANSGQTVGRIFADYHADRLSYRWRFFERTMRGKNVEDVEISTMLRGMADPKYKQEVYRERWESATGRLDAAKESLAKHQARIDAGKDVDPQVLLDARKRVTNAENGLRELRDEMAVPQYFRDVSREFGLSVAGAAILAQTAQDFGVSNPTALSFIEMGGAITAVLAPKVGTAPVILPGYLALGLINLVAGATMGVRFGKGRAQKEAEQWTTFLGNLSPEQYAELEVHANRIIEITDQMRATGLFTEADLEVTAAELVNIPLLRLYQQQVAETVSIADLQAMDESLLTLSQSLTQERIALNNMSRSIEKLLPLEDEAIAETNPELAKFYVDLRKLHAGLEQDYRLREAAVKAEMEERNATQMLYLSGRAIMKDGQGNIVIPDYKAHFDEYETFLVESLQRDGKTADEIATTLREVQQQRLDTLIEFGQAARANPLDAEFDESVHLAAVMDTQRRLSERAVDARYRAWEKMAPEDTFMDAQIILKDLQTQGGSDLADPQLQQIGVETSKWADEAPGIKYMYAGNRIGPTSSARMSQLFGAGADRYLSRMRQSFEENGIVDSWDNLLEQSGANTQSDPFLQWRAVKGFLEGAENDELRALSDDIPVEVWRGMGADFALPISPVEMRMMSSALGDREFAALRSRRPAGALEPGRVRNNIFALAESEEYGFKADFFNGGGTPVGSELVSELRATNQYYVDEWVDRWMMDPTLKGLVYPQGGTKLRENKILISYPAGRGPANQLTMMLDGLGKLETGATQAQIDDVVKPLIQGTGGRKVTDSAGNEVFVLDADSDATKALREVLAIRARRIVRRSQGAESLIEGLDPDMTTEETIEYLKNAAYDPSLLGMTPEDEKVLDALLSLKAYKFDADGNVVDAEFLINADSAVELISFDTLRRTNKRANELATKYEGEFTGIVDQWNASAQEAFTSENAYRRAALRTAERFQGQSDAEISQQFYTLSTSKNGQGVIEELRNSHVNLIVRDFTRRNGRNPNAEELETLTNNAVEGFEQYRKDQISRYIISQSVEIDKQQVTTGAKAVRGSKLNLQSFDNMLGDLDSPDPAMREKAEFLVEVLGQEHYDDVKAIADFVALKTDTYDNVRFSGVARSYSVESYISRLYSISRDVVSPRYVLTEVAIQAGRVANQEQFQKMVADPEVARAVAEIIRTGEMLDERGARRLFEAVAAYTARTYSDVQESEESLDRQMTDIQPALRPGGATIEGLTQ